MAQLSLDAQLKSLLHRYSVKWCGVRAPWKETMGRGQGKALHNEIWCPWPQANDGLSLSIFLHELGHCAPWKNGQLRWRGEIDAETFTLAAMQHLGVRMNFETKSSIVMNILSYYETVRTERAKDRIVMSALALGVIADQMMGIAE